MSFLASLPSPSLPFRSPGLPPIGFNAAKAYANSSGSPASAVILLGLNFSYSAWKINQHSLLASALTWGIIWAVCTRVKAGRYSGAGTGRRKGYSISGGGGWSGGGTPIMLAGSVLLAGICESASGVESPWLKAGVPSAAYFIRSSLRIDNANGLPLRGMRRVMVLVMMASAITLQPAFVSNSVLALGVCSAVFSALALVLLERSLAELSETSGMPSSSSTGCFGSWRNFALVGKDLGVYLSLGFLGASLTFERFPLRILDHMDVYFEKDITVLALKLVVVSILGTAQWAITPFVMMGYSSVSVGFLELITTLLMGLYSAFSGIRFLGMVGAFIGMSGYFIATPGTERVAVLSQLFRTRSAQLMTLLVFFLTALVVWGFESLSDNTGMSLKTPSSAPIHVLNSGHPIPKLIQDAEARYKKLQERQSNSLSEAVAEYRRRYNMNPPPGFDKWYEYARNRNSIIIDDYDTIYHSLKPFWGLPPQEIRKRAREAIGFNDPIGLHDNKLLHASVRGGAVNVGGQGPDWQKEATQGMIEKFVAFLPDMELGFNIHDEPRIVVPNDMLTQYLDRADTVLSKIKNSDPLGSDYTPLPVEERGSVPDFPRTLFNVFAHQPTWNGAQMSCPPDSPAKSIDINVKDDTSRFSVRPLGFIYNTTEASDICLSPSLQRRHGFFDRPNAFNVAHQLIPVFSQSKPSSFNDILYPSPWYWADRVKYDDAKDINWDQKHPNLYWRGSTTGGFSRNGGWKRQHRQHTVSVINKNDTAKVLVQEHHSGSGDWSIREVKRETLSTLFDVRFSHVGQCDPKDCDDQHEFFDIAPKANQDDAWQWKYLLDMDGNAFSGRYYAFLGSNSAVFKQAIFREWHEEWIVPWVHYVPVSMDLEEIAELMRYFEIEQEGKKAIQKIAQESRKWAKAVLRKEDFEIWFFRLLLEYGRVIDDNRETIGFLG